MIAPFEAPRLKLERAGTHLQELREAIEAYLSEKPWVVVVEPFPGMDSWRSHAWIARMRRPIPLVLSAIIGDVVHNLRTALDLLACDLVRVQGGNAKDVYFPFSANASELPNMIKQRKFYRAGADVIQAVERLQPYAGGNLLLRSIHDMDIADKHQALLPTLSAASVPFAEILRSPIKFERPEFSTLLVKDGQIVVGTPAWAGIPLGTELPVRLSLGFGDGPGFGNRPIVEFLEALLQTANHVVEALAALRPGARFPVAP